MATRLVEQWLKIARGEISSQNSNVSNKENILDSQSHISVKPVPMFCDSSSDNMVDLNTVDGSYSASQLNEACSLMEVVDDDDCAQGVGDSGENEGLVFKITMKDGKQTLAKINETSPKKYGNRTSIESLKDSDSDDRSTKVRSEKSRSTDEGGRHKDGKDRERSKDVDKHKKSSSSSSSHKISSSSKSSSSSSSKHNSSSSSSKSSSSHSKSHKSSSSSSSGYKNSSGSLSSSSRDKHKSSSSSSSKSSSSSSKDSSKDKKSSSESSKTQAEKDKDTLAKIQPKSLEKVGKIPKKSSSSNSSSSDNTTKKPTTDQNDQALAAKKKSISIEVRKDIENRPKTVKTYNSQFRSHGLGEEAPPPPSRRDLKKPAATVPTNGIPIVPKRSLSPTNATKELEKKLKLTTSPTVEKPGAIKLIPAKPKRKYSIEWDYSNGESCFIFPPQVVMIVYAYIM